MHLPNQTIRTGDVHEFDCPEGFFVEGPDETITSVVKQCQYNGNFDSETRKCELIPCTDADISEITPTEGDFVTTAVGPLKPADSIYFTCADENKVGREIKRVRKTVKTIKRTKLIIMK